MPVSYRERLHVPLRWWVQGTMGLAVIWLTFVVATPEWLAWTATGMMLVIVYGLFGWIGGAAVEVRDGVLYAGAAHIPLGHVGAVEALDAEETRRALGVEADARAFLVIRPYLKRSVRIQITDPDDPTPYWLVSSRHPATLAQALSGLPNGERRP